jgi:16S rRNA (guanine1516-N2)-methyltransferase
VLSERLKLPLSPTIPQDMLDGQYVLWIDEQGVSLTMTGRHNVTPISVDFVSGAATHRRHYGGGKSQLVAKAIGLKSKTIRPHQPLTVVDLTAGLGQDGFVLATLGCYVTLVERCPSIYQLLSDGFSRALGFSKSSEAVNDVEFGNILTRMNLVEATAADYLERLEHIAEQPDIIYLDPMFPKRNKSAQANKNMRALQVVVGDDTDAGELLSLALNKARFRVVVKRPRKAPALHQQYLPMCLPEPGLVLTGTSTRYDIYLNSPV